MTFIIPSIQVQIHVSNIQALIMNEVFTFFTVFYSLLQYLTGFFLWLLTVFKNRFFTWKYMIFLKGLNSEKASEPNVPGHLTIWHLHYEELKRCLHPLRILPYKSITIWHKYLTWCIYSSWLDTDTYTRLTEEHWMNTKMSVNSVSNDRDSSGRLLWIITT